MGKMSVYSLDYDGCMAGNSIDEIINTNEQLIAEIIARIEGGEEVSIYVGSNRQGIQGDILNSSRHGCPSVFAAYPALVDHIKEQLPDNLKEKIKFNNYLLADAQQGIVPGTNFDIYQQIPYVKNKSLPQSEDFEAIKRLKKEKKINDLIGDETKIPTLYAQMQQVASFNPSSKVEFIFKDDRKDLLDNLHLFYTQNPQLIPANITLKFEQKFSKQLQELLEEEKNKIINDSSLTSEQKNEQIERDVLGKRYQVFETKSIQGKAKEVDSNYGQTATAMLVIATQIATKKHEPEKKFSTPRQIYDNPKKAIGEILNYSYSLSEVFVEKDFSATFKRYLEVQEDALLEEKVSKRMNVLIDVHEEIHKNELTSDHEFQVFDGPIRHASYNVAVTGPFCMKDTEPYDKREFKPLLEKILGTAEAKIWDKKRQIREQDKIAAAAENGISLFNLQEASVEFVEETLLRLNKNNPDKYKSVHQLFENDPKKLHSGMAIIYNTEELTPIENCFIRDDLGVAEASNQDRPKIERVLGQAFKFEEGQYAGQYIVMQNIHGEHITKAEEGQENLKQAMSLPPKTKDAIERAIKDSNNDSPCEYRVFLTGDTNRRRPPLDDQFKYIGVNSSLYTTPEATFFDSKQCMDYTDGSFFVTYGEDGQQKEDKIQIVASTVFGKDGHIAPLEVPARFALKNNHFQEFPFASHYSLDDFHPKFKELDIKAKTTPEKNDFNVCRVKITSTEDISSQLREKFRYVETIAANEGFQYFVYPNNEITDLKIAKRDYLKISMRSELINLIKEGDTQQLGETIKEWMEYYPDILKQTLAINDDINNDIFLIASTTPRFHIGDARGNIPNGSFPNRPSISAILKLCGA